MLTDVADRSRTDLHRAPRVSVVMPVFNAERFLAEAIDSVLGQEFEDFELLVADDGSTDLGPEIAATFGARDPARIHYLEHPGRANRGAAATRNLALTHARGELVAFIDADDRWYPAKLREQVELFDQMPAVDAVCGVVNFWSSYAGGEDQLVPSGHIRNRAIAPPEALLNVYPLGRADPPCPSDLLVRRSVVEAIGGFEADFVWQLYEDQAFLAKLFLNATVYFADRIWLDYRIHDTSCTVRTNADQLQPVARHYFLDWFERYLGGTRYRHDVRIRLALAIALRPYRHPHLSSAGRLAKKWLRQARTSTGISG